MMKKALLAGAFIATAFPSCAQSVTNVGGFDSGSLPIQTATPNSSSHAAGSSVGGLFKIPVARTLGGGALPIRFIWISSGGAVTQLLVRLWDVNPTGGLFACADQTAYVGTIAADQHLVTIPFAFTPAAPASTVGDTKTYAEQDFTPPLSIRNQDSTQTQFVYACVVTTATDTADESAAVYANLLGPQD